MKAPTPPELAKAPELASLAMAHAALELMDSALFAAHPALHPEDECLPREEWSPLLDLTWELSLALMDLQVLIDAYAERVDARACQEAAKSRDRDF